MPSSSTRPTVISSVCQRSECPDAETCQRRMSSERAKWPSNELG